MAGTHWPTDLLMPQPKRARSLPQTAKNLDENPRVVLNPADCNIGKWTWPTLTLLS